MFCAKISIRCAIFMHPSYQHSVCGFRVLGTPLLLQYSIYGHHLLWDLIFARLLFRFSESIEEEKLVHYIMSNRCLIHITLWKAMQLLLFWDCMRMSVKIVSASYKQFPVSVSSKTDGRCWRWSRIKTVIGYKAEYVGWLCFMGSLIPGIKLQSICRGISYKGM